jgi:hypothetical protein
MTHFSLSGSPPPAPIRRLSPWKQRVVARYQSDHDAGRALRGHEASGANEWPDPSYWTAYDHLAIERETQALRRAYAWALIGRCWRWLKRAITPRT